ncbi:hypothetical protein F5Y14DRAFT_431134 [Nemania sp. NC0429]|nr:hypothetical protein F5Y14DRAFT_431134 [Nemania sp. NC0429]
MDWGGNLPLFAKAGDFVCIPNVKTNKDKKDEAQYITNGMVAAETLDTEERWDKMIRYLESSPTNGCCIVFIPSATGVRFSGQSVRRSYFTNISISGDKWNTIGPPLKLPACSRRVIERDVSSIVSVIRTDDNKDNLRMQVGMTPSNALDAFCFASTHFESKRFTSAVMIGCSEKQIELVGKYVSLLGDSYRHPLLMVGIFAELQLKRFEQVVSKLKTDHRKLREELLNAKDDGNAANDGAYGVQPDGTMAKFSWDLIKKVLSTHDELQEVQAEIELEKRQLERACTQADQLREEKKDDFARLFAERFHDIIHRSGDLLSQCQLCVESLSFSTELIRSELARQEANTSARTTKIGTIIATVALIYLPITGVATILAMPIFGWANDWKNLSFQSVQQANDTIDDSSATSGSAGATGTGLPVVSGYIWVYLAISALFILLTFGPFWFYVYWHKRRKQLMAFAVRFMRSAASIRHNVSNYIAKKLGRQNYQHSVTDGGNKSSTDSYEMEALVHHQP